MTRQPAARTRSLLAVGGWLIAAAAATAVGLLATGAVGTSITGTTPAPLSQQQVDRALARSSPAPSARTSASPSTAPGGVTRALDTRGGTLIARCQNGQASLVSWSPAQGYDTEDIRPGPAPAAAITFETHGTAIQVRVGCTAGIPTAHTTTRTDADQDQDQD